LFLFHEMFLPGYDPTSKPQPIAVQRKSPNRKIAPSKPQDSPSKPQPIAVNSDIPSIPKEKGNGLGLSSSSKSSLEKVLTFSADAHRNSPEDGVEVGAVGTLPEAGNFFPKNDDDDTPKTASVEALEAEKPQPKTYAATKADLIRLLEETNGAYPDEKLVRDILETLEGRGQSLGAYLRDIAPRAKRLDRSRNGGAGCQGFFLKHARQFGGAEQRPAAAPQAEAPAAACSLCNRSGRVEGVYCSCAMGHDLARAEAKLARKLAKMPAAARTAAAGPGVGSSAPEAAR
jgi:hypothetical protein